MLMIVMVGGGSGGGGGGGSDEGLETSVRDARDLERR